MKTIFLYICIFSILVCAQEKEEVSKPHIQNINIALLNSNIESFAKKTPRLYSVHLMHNGAKVYSKFFHGYPSVPRAVNMRSVSKTIISALVGIAAQKGLLKFDDRVVEHLSEFFPNPIDDARKKDMTIRHLLTMTSGLPSVSGPNYRPWTLTDHWLKALLAKPMQYKPGEKFNYSTGDTHLLSAILTKVTKMDTRSFAEKNLFDPLQIKVTSWYRDPQGFYIGGNDLFLLPQDLLKFGQLVLDGGKKGDQKILPQQWIKESTKKSIVIAKSGPDVIGYGWLWWLYNLNDCEAYAAVGYGGQFLLVFPKKNLLCVVTCATDWSPPNQYSKIRDFVKNGILPCFH